MHGLLLMTTLLLSANAFATESAQRDPRRSWIEYAEQSRKNTKDASDSAMSQAKLFKGDVYAGVTQWPVGSLSERFTAMRDERRLKWTRNSSFPRRIPWLYPQDGCYARAALGNDYYKDNELPIPKKIFAFGDLRVDTAYDEDGHVTWWYHVAQVVDVNGVRYVLDPAIDASGPMTIEAWLAKMGEPAKIEVSICEAGTYSPRSSCSDGTVGNPASPNSFLNKEWSNVKELGQDPEQVLGEAPPWQG